MNMKNPEKILVVDNEVRMRESLKTLLHNCGYEVEMVEDGEKAICLMNQNNFELIIADINIPKASGI